MHIRFWGTRGSIPSPGADTAKFGGNTSCVEIIAQDGTHIILDCGTGARLLGQQMVKEKTSPLRLHLLVGHTHWDHIQGFPFFVPAFLPDTELNVYAPRGFRQSLEEALAGQMQDTYFPMRLRDLQSRMQFTELGEGFFRLGGVLVETQHLNHTAPTIAYRISADGATVVYSTDHEPFWPSDGLRFGHPGDQRHVDFLGSADLVIHDAQYTETEYPAKIGWGHSTIEYATDVAAAAGARRLALFHHEPVRTDSALRKLERVARDRAIRLGSSTEVFAAAEGMELSIDGTTQTRDRPALAALGHPPIAGRCVLVAGMDNRELTQIEQEMRDDHLFLIRSAHLSAALALAGQILPDLLIFDISDHASGAEELQKLRSAYGSNVALLALTDQLDGHREHLGDELSNVDFLAKPYSPTMLRSRVHAWLARAATLEQPRLTIAGSPAGTPFDRSTRPSYHELLSGVPLFAELTSDELNMLSAHAVEQAYDSGDVLIQQGAKSNEILVILRGRVRVVELPDEPFATEIGLGEMSPGQVIGELAILTGLPRSATVMAAEPVVCLAIPGEDFMKLLHSSPALGSSLAEVLAGRIYDTDQRVSRFAPDSVTGLPGRWMLHEQYGQLSALARRRGAGMMLVLLDILNLKSINDTAGYAIGDEVLRVTADTLRETLRKADVIGRWGGDEFVVVPMDAHPKVAEYIIRRLNQRLDELGPELGLEGQIRFSCGVATAELPPDDIDALVRLADQDLRVRKREAR